MRVHVGPHGAERCPTMRGVRVRDKKGLGNRDGRGEGDRGGRAGTVTEGARRARGAASAERDSEYGWDGTRVAGQTEGQPHRGWQGELEEEEWVGERLRFQCQWMKAPGLETEARQQ